MIRPPSAKNDPNVRHATMRRAPVELRHCTPSGLVATPLPLILETAECPYGTLYGHLAHVNPQWRTPPAGEALAIFMGPDAYVSPSWYET
jgi:transcriptional regulator